MLYFSTIVISIMTAFAVAGIIDNLFLKDKLGLGPEFMKGMEMIGPLCVAIVGIIALVPEIAWVIEHTLTPVYMSLGLDPSMAVTMILAIDMGGFQLAKSVALDSAIGNWAGVVYGSMMGATIVFSIPVGLAAIQKKDVGTFSKGILYGIAAIPVGTFAGGLIMGIPFLTVVKNLIIPVIFSVIIIFCLAKFSTGTTNVFKGFSVFMNIVAMIGLALAMINDLILIPLADTGAFNMASVPFFRLLGSTSEGIGVAGSVGLVLSGALPFVYCLQKWLKRPLAALGKKVGMTEVGITGFLLSAANNMAMFATFHKMKEKEQILNVAFAVCAAFVIGDHLAFTAVNAPEAIAPMMVAKLISGIVAVALASIFYKPTKKS
ncbi:MAG: ethanolamine utilization protein EutH [Lachnospiraceae bacterium]|nr:ethanolamine utilization protein EutH [Lachnospiraceae bacterium]